MGMIARIVIISGFVIGNLLPISLQAQTKAYLESAWADVSAKKIIVSTGLTKRTWLITDYGMTTISLYDEKNNKEWASTKTTSKCDWDLPGLINDSTKADLVKQSVKESTDDGFTSIHLEVKTLFYYKTAKLAIEHIIWVYPHATGLRTQLRVKALPGYLSKGLPEKENQESSYGLLKYVPSARIENLPIDLSILNQRHYWGYYNNPGGRYDQSKDMLEEKIVRGWPVFQDEDIQWASAMSIEYGNESFSGVCIVKESNKTVNNPGHYSGAFYSGPKGVRVTGWGLKPNEIVSDRFRECWATWTILFDGGNDGLQLALKRFDRQRFPVVPERDIMTICDTWGPANPMGTQFAKQDYLLKEIPLIADLGISTLRIDLGWQKGEYYTKDIIRFRPRYTDGWKTLKAASDKAGIKLGLWVAIKNASTADLIKNIEEAAISTWKVDYDHLSSRADFEFRHRQIRAIMKHARGKTQFAFCPEYDDPRYGWYYFREYGPMFFQNVQENLPAHLTMVPYQVLRRHWQMCKYYNANKLQTMMQNPKRANSDRSDANLHSHSYCFAMAFPFVPVFFQSAQNLNPEEHEELKKIISLYNKYSNDLFNSYTFPIGDEPNNFSWSGFQMFSDFPHEGYLLVFREINNTEPSRLIQMKFAPAKKIRLTNLETGEISEIESDKNSTILLYMEKAASYKFFKYEFLK